MRNKFTTIRLKPDVSTIDFEQLDRIIEPVTTPEITETDSLTKLGNSGHPFSPLLAKTGNYQPPSVEEIPDEGESDSRKKKFPGQRNKERKKARISKRGGKFIQPPYEELVKPFDEFPEASFEIKMIAAAPFFHVSKQERVKLFSVSLKDVEKTLRLKQRTDPVTKLPLKLHEFLELFFRKKANKLPPHRPYDHKIKFMESEQPRYDPLYSIS